MKVNLVIDKISKHKSNFDDLLFSIGDDVTIAGKIVEISNGCICIETKLGTRIWIESGDIKTHRPIKEEDDLK